MEIIPGQGIPQASLGADRSTVREVLGVPTAVDGRSEHHHDLDPAVIVRYDAEGRVEMFEIPYSGTPGREVTLHGIQLTYRPLAIVVAELAAAGLDGDANDVAVDFAEGFSIWSMGSLMVEDLGLSGDGIDEDDEVVDAVSVAAAGYSAEI